MGFDSDFEIPEDVLAEASSDIKLRTPDGAPEGTWNENVILLGSAVKQPGELTIVELTFKVADNGTPKNVGVIFDLSFFMTNASLANKDLLRTDQRTAISLRLLQNYLRTMGLEPQGMLARLRGMDSTLLSGKPIVARLQRKIDKNEVLRLNVSRFAAVS